MDLKLSNYNILVDEFNNGDHLLYNSFTSALGVLENKNRFIYDNIGNLNYESLDKEELECIKTMKENGFLVDSNFNEYDFLKVNYYRNRHSKKSLMLTIAPTMTCNLLCTYCYEKYSDKPTIMNEDIQGLLIEFINKKIQHEDIKYISVTWYGGEPLIALDIIRKLSSKIIKLCNENKIEYFSNIVTNGILLDRETVIVLKEECKIDRAQVTIDGLENTHNKRRGLKDDKKNSFRTIIKNIDNCLDIIEITIRINVDKKNMDETIELMNYFEKEKKWDNKTNYYFSKVRDHVSENDSLCLTKNKDYFSSQEFFKFSVEMYKKMYAKGYRKFFEGFYPNVPDIPCSAVNENCYLIDPVGDLYTCWILIGNKDRKIGSLYDTEYDIDNSCEKINWLSTEIPVECENCTMLPLCQGGCPIYYMNGQLECSYGINALKEFMKNVYKIRIEENYNLQTESLRG